MNTTQEKIVYFVRHGQSEDNAAPVFQALDSPLSKIGRQQAEQIAERISNLNFDALITSHLERAKQTAEIIAKKTGKRTEYSELFVECIKPTYINGKPYTNEKADTMWREWEKSLYTPNMRVEDGENFEDLFARADKALSFLQERPEQSIVVVTHAYFLKTLAARVLLGNALSGEVFKEFQQHATVENTGITVLRYHDSFEAKPSWHLWVYNDHAHLG